MVRALGSCGAPGEGARGVCGMIVMVKNGFHRNSAGGRACAASRAREGGEEGGAIATHPRVRWVED